MRVIITRAARARMRALARCAVISLAARIYVVERAMRARSANRAQRRRRVEPRRRRPDTAFARFSSFTPSTINECRTQRTRQHNHCRRLYFLISLPLTSSLPDAMRADSARDMPCAGVTLLLDLMRGARCLITTARLRRAQWRAFRRGARGAWQVRWCSVER